MGILYCLMSMGINFIYGIMKVINWSMGEFFMIGAYVQYLLLTYIIGAQFWFLGIFIAAIIVFILGAVVQRILIKPMFVGIIEAKMEYATIVTISLAIFLRNMAVLIGGPYIYPPPDYAGPTQLLTLPISGNRLIALIGALLLLGIFYYFIKKTWTGKAFQGVAQNRPGVQTAGVNVLKYDTLAFGLGTALAGAGGWPQYFWYIRFAAWLPRSGGLKLSLLQVWAPYREFLWPAFHWVLRRVWGAPSFTRLLSISMGSYFWLLFC